MLPKVEQTPPHAHTIHLDLRSGDVAQFLLLADVHIDSVYCRRDILKRLLDKAVNQNALVFVFGDLFDAMQGPGDKRASPKDQRPEHFTPAYFNGVVNDAVEFFSPYARHLAVVAKGNHEMAVAKHYGISLLDMFAHGLRLADPRSPVCVGGYEGWLRFMIRLYTVRTQIRWYYHHGAGASPMMTFGTLDVRRTASYVPDCDAFISGHTHDQYIVPMSRLRLTIQGAQYRDVMWAVRVPTLKDERRPDSWAVRQKHPPKPLGGVWAAIEAMSAKSVRAVFSPDVE